MTSWHSFARIDDLDWPSIFIAGNDLYENKESEEGYLRCTQISLIWVFMKNREYDFDKNNATERNYLVQCSDEGWPDHPCCYSHEHTLERTVLTQYLLFCFPLGAMWMQKIRYVYDEWSIPMQTTFKHLALHCILDTTVDVYIGYIHGIRM